MRLNHATREGREGKRQPGNRQNKIAKLESGKKTKQISSPPNTQPMQSYYSTAKRDVGIKAKNLEPKKL